MRQKHSLHTTNNTLHGYETTLLVAIFLYTYTVEFKQTTKGTEPLLKCLMAPGSYSTLMAVFHNQTCFDIKSTDVSATGLKVCLKLLQYNQCCFNISASKDSVELKLYCFRSLSLLSSVASCDLVIEWLQWMPHGCTVLDATPGTVLLLSLCLLSAYRLSLV